MQLGRTAKPLAHPLHLLLRCSWSLPHLEISSHELEMIFWAIKKVSVKLEVVVKPMRPSMKVFYRAEAQLEKFEGCFIRSRSGEELKETYLHGILWGRREEIGFQRGEMPNILDISLAILSNTTGETFLTQIATQGKKKILTVSFRFK